MLTTVLCVTACAHHCALRHGVCSPLCSASQRALTIVLCITAHAYHCALRLVASEVHETDHLEEEQQQEHVHHRVHAAQHLSINELSQCYNYSIEQLVRAAGACFIIKK